MPDDAMTPEEQAARDAVDAAEAMWRSEIMPTNDRRRQLEIHYVAQAIEQARREEREVCAKATCERCRITPHLPAFECHVHGEGRYPWWCHDSGVEGWGHYLCTAAAIRARAQEGT